MTELRYKLADNLEDLPGAHVVHVATDFYYDPNEQPAFSLATTDHCDNDSAYAANAIDSTMFHALNCRRDNASRYSAGLYYGMMIETGCARASSEGIPQYRAYCRQVGEADCIDTTKPVFCKFGISGKLLIGQARAQFPLSDIILEVSMHIIDDDVPLLLSLADMARLGFYAKNQVDQLVHPKFVEATQVKRHHGHPFISWHELHQSFFNHTELQRLYNGFGHPHEDKL